MSQFCMSCMSQYADGLDACPHCGYARNTPEEGVLLPPGTILSERYIAGRCRDCGDHHALYIGYDAQLECRVAVREYLPALCVTRPIGETAVSIIGGSGSPHARLFQEGLTRFRQEAVRLAEHCRFDGIVKVFDIFEENHTAYSIMEFLEGETLASRLEREKTIPPEEAALLMRSIAGTLKPLHDDGIIHGNLAPDHLFLCTDGSVRFLGWDTGSFAEEHEESLEFLRYSGFFAPERYRSDLPVGTDTDVYSLGAVLYRMVTGSKPADALERMSGSDLLRRHSSPPMPKHLKKVIPGSLYHAIRKAMAPEREKRFPSVDAFMAALQL